ncbi:hypothetical protein [Fontivita pretiosa]|uniref:hypothetical protein n=1 Tax=Fontivita pretiosa TaxID=2989684 RepID=UPI003D1849A2
MSDSATDLSQLVRPREFLAQAMKATSIAALEALLKTLPIVGEHEYVFDPKNPAQGWRDGYLHWYAVGGERGNAGRIKLAGKPENPIAERTVNAMEAIIEMMRRRELLNGAAPMPTSPREAVMRYFDLPPLDQLPLYEKEGKRIRGMKAREYARELARHIRVRLERTPASKELAVIIEDDGIGQTPARIHETLLSLGESDKGDKTYLIGIFGQGGSSSYAASSMSWLMSRRVSDLLAGDADGIGWTVVKAIHPKPPRRDPYYAYLAMHPDGRVPNLPAAAADALGFKHGTVFAHLNYNFGPSRAEIARDLYQGLNHLLFNPVLPYELYTRPTPDPMWGNGYRLRRLPRERKPLDKTFDPQQIPLTRG